MKPPLSSNRIKTAFIIAAVADAMQLPLTLATLTGFLGLPAEILDVAIDIAVMVFITRLVGFHWMLLPTLFLEFVPALDLFPTWTACVAFIISQRRRAAMPQPAVTIVDAEIVQLPPPQLKAPGTPDLHPNQ